MKATVAARAMAYAAALGYTAASRILERPTAERRATPPHRAHRRADPAGASA